MEKQSEILFASNLLVVYEYVYSPLRQKYNTTKHVYAGP